MASGTKVRSYSRLLDSSTAPFWVIGPDGKLVYLSAAVSEWLGIDVEQLAGRRSIAGAPISDDPLDFVAASLSPPPGFKQRGTASLHVQPPPINGRKVQPLDVRFVRLGALDQSSTIAIAGEFNDEQISGDLKDAVAIRRRLDAWRKRHTALATIATAGASASAKRLRSRLEVAASTRTHVGLFGPKGCGSVSIGSRIHQLSAPDEPLVRIDGSLMDAELLEASMMPLINRLAESKTATATVLVCDMDDTPVEAQQRLSELLVTFGIRLRLIALCRRLPEVLAEPFQEADGPDTVPLLDERTSVGLHRELVDFLSGFNIVIDPLAQRVEDIPILATAALDARQAAGEGAAERFSRAALDALVIYPWPENFDELDAAIRHAIRSAPHESIGVEHLPLAIRSFRPAENPVSQTVKSITLDEAVRRYEASIIQETLEATDGNRAEAARRLGISRPRLLRKLDDLKSSDSGSNGK